MQNQVVPTIPSQIHQCNHRFHHVQKHRVLCVRVLLSIHKTGPHSNAWLSWPILLTLPGSLNSLLIHLTSCEYDICNPIYYLFEYEVILLECHFSTLQVNKPCSSPVLSSALLMNGFGEDYLSSPNSRRPCYQPQTVWYLTV